MTQATQASPVRDFLTQAFQIDQLIQNKLDRMAYLKELEAMMQETLTSDKAADELHGISSMKKTVETELDRLMETKREISLLIGRIPSLPVRSIMEQRYLCYKTWADIAQTMACSERQAYNLHRKGLSLLDGILGKPIVE